MFTDESSFYLHNLAIGNFKLRKQHCLKENYSSMGAIYSEIFGGNMDCQKYVNILENNVNKIKEVLQKWRFQWFNDSKHKSNVLLNMYI